MTIYYIIVGSIILALFSYRNQRTNDLEKSDSSFSNVEKKKVNLYSFRFIEFWNHFINFSIAGLIGYYFAIVRWPQIVLGSAVTLVDLLVLLAFGTCLSGYFVYVIKNITEGIQAILSRFLFGSK